MMLAILFVSLVAIGTVCAAENVTDDDSIGMDDSTDTIDQEPNTEHVLTTEEQNFTQLNQAINGNNNNEINLTSDYKYCEGDDSFKNGIIINRDLTIYGNGHTINGDGKARIFKVSRDHNVVFHNITFTNGYADKGGAIYGDSKAINCIFTENTAEFGGAVYFKNGNIIGCNFSNNNARSSGGAICIIEGNIIGCNFTNHSSGTHGGAIFFEGPGNITNCNFIDNFATDGGGAISVLQSGKVTVDTCIFKTNSDTTEKIHNLPPTLNVDNFTTFYGFGEKLTFDLKTNSGIPVTNGNISIRVYKNNNVWIGNYSCLSGEGWNINLPVGFYYVIFNTEYAEFKPINRTIIVNKAKTEFVANAIAATYNINRDLTIILKDVSGKPVTGVVVSVDLNGVKTFTTDINGQIKVLTRGLAPETYSVKITFSGNENYLESSVDVKITIKKAAPKIIAKKKTYKKSKKVKKYAIVLKDNTGKAIKNAKVTLKIAKKTYIAKTNKKGKATFKVKKLNNKGKFKAKIKYKGNKYYKAVTKKVKITIK